MKKYFIIFFIFFFFLTFLMAEDIDVNHIKYYLEKIVSFAPHPSGSKNIQKLRKFIIDELKKDGLVVKKDEFIADTPYGKIKMVNIVGILMGKSGGEVYLASHYDSKLFKKFKFVGANDSGSSTAALLELARVLSKKKNFFTYVFVFFDGEEAFGRDITDRDGLYGSKHFVKKLKEKGALSNIEAFILLDMIGDKDLQISRDNYSSKELFEIFSRCASIGGYPEIISPYPTYVIDDHTPFLKEGVKAIDIIDFNYGPNNSYWHTKEDNLKHVSTNSIYLVCKAILCMLRELESF